MPLSLILRRPRQRSSQKDEACARRALPIRAGAFELAQDLVAALDRGIERGLRALAAGKGLFQFVLDRAADQHEGAEPDALGILRRRMQRDLLERDRRAGIALVKSLRARQLEGGAG